MSADTGQTCRSSAPRAGALFDGGSRLERDHAEQIVFTLDNPVDRDAFTAAWRNLAARHAILRNAFHDAHAGGTTGGDIEIEMLDLANDATREMRFAEFRSARMRMRFDSGTPPLFHVALVNWDDASSRVVWTLRRALLDWRSMSTLLRELFANYRTIRAGGDDAEVTAALVSGSPGWERDDTQATDAAFWRECFRDFNPVRIDLPRCERAADAPDYVHVERRLDAATSDGVRRLHKAADVTLNNLAQAAWALLLSHYARSDDVAFGVLRSCRRSGPPGLEDALGSFMNIVPLRARIAHANAFELLWQMRDAHRLVREHENSRLADIERSTDASAALFDTVLEFDLRDPMAALEDLLAGEGPRDFRHDAPPLADMHVQVYGEEDIRLRLACAPEVADEETAARILDHYANLLTRLAREPWIPVKDVSCLRAEDALPCCWPHDVDASPNLPGTIAARFAHCAAANPGAIAIACGARSMTYAELNAAANRLAHRLIEKGARADRLVGLCVDRSIEQIVGMLGILKSGAGYLPLDPAYPEERLQFLIEDSGVDLVVATGSARSALPGSSLAFIEPSVAPGEANETDPAMDATGDSLAYIIYTSGSTGQPKGVMVTQRNVVRLFDACQSWLHADDRDVWTLFHSFAFDFSVWEIWGALLHGGRLEIVTRDIARSPDAFHQLLADRGVTILSQTPSAFRELMRIDAEATRELPALRCVVFGGEKLDLGSLSGWIDRHGDDSPELINMYGITETTVHVTYRRITRHDVANDSGSLVGWPLPDLYVRLLDADGRNVPPGVRGEICVGGAGVARGYLNRPELNARRFIDDPHAASGNARLYRSGDFARRMRNGELCYLGREDNEVKIRGFRIDLGEISSALKRIPGIAEALIVPRETADGSRRLFAYYVADNGEHTEASLREQLARQLPEHMLPAMFIALPALPMNANNKIDYKALPDPADVVAAAVTDPPRTPAEITLAGLWKEVLGRGDVGRNEDFFGLGGDSILALKLVACARAAGLELMPRDVFNHPVLADLASHAGTAVAKEEDADVNKDGPWALTPIQRWFFDQGFEKPDHWNEGFLFRLPPDTNVELLERAMLDVVRRHDALHVRFLRDANGKWMSKPVEPADALEFSRIELDHLDEAERREAVGLITQEIQESLSLSAGLLVRAAHFTGGLEDGARLLIVIHRLAVDAASWTIILKDLDAAYRALEEGHDATFVRRSISYAGWAAHLERQAQSALIGSEHAYWEQVIDALDDSALADAVHDPGRERDARTVRITLEAPATAALLGGIHDAYGTETHELLLAALSRAVAVKWPHAGQLRVDVQRHGRSDNFGELDVSGTVGWFSVLQPVALDQSHAGNPARLICDVKTRMRSAPHQGAGWGMLRYLRANGAVAFGRAQAQRAPVLFNYRGQFERALASGMFQHVFEDTGRERGAENHLAHALTVTAAVHDDRMEFEFRFSPKAIPEADVGALAGHYADALHEIIRHCRTRNGIVRSPVDFPLARLSQEELDAFPVALENVEEILPLSPIQRLHHALSGTDRDVGFDQWVFHLQGSIDEGAFEAGWRELLRRHDALRTVFVDRGLGEPHQVVLRHVEFRLQKTDWRLLDETTQQQRLKEFLDADRRQGFELHVAPLTRVTLIRAGDDRWMLVWSHHQALVDGWSWPILAQELGELHDAQVAGREPVLDAPGSYRSYIAWLMNRDLTEYAAFWREHLGGRAQRTLITRSRRRDDGRAGPHDAGHASIALPEELGAGVMQLARKLRLTPGVVYQAAWALLLSGITLRFDVTLGVAFSGRTAGVADAANTVGPFLNDLPVRVRINPEQRVDEWLSSLRATQADVNHYQNVSPLEVHEWSGSPAGARLFDALLVLQNYATGDATRRWGERIKVREFSAGVRTNYPLTVAIMPGPAHRIEFFHDKALLDDAAVEALGNDLIDILRTITRTPDVRVATVINHVSVQNRTETTVLDADKKPMRRATDTALQEEAAATGDAIAADDDGNGDDMTALVASVCRDVLGVENFDIDRNFFDVGAQSVALIEIHERLSRKLKRAFPIVRLFQHPTIAALAHWLAHGEPDDSEERLRDAGRRGAVRRAAMQRRRRPSTQTGRFER